MAKTLILGNNPKKWWIKELSEINTLSVPNISTGKVADLTCFISTLPKDLECIVIDADSLPSDNNELSLDIALYIRLMLHDCRQTSLSSIVMVSDLSYESFKGYGAKSMILMTQNVSLVGSESAGEAVRNASPLTPGEYVEGFLNLIKIVPQEKIEGRHSIANEWGADILNYVISDGVKSEIIPLKKRDSSYFKYSSIAALSAPDIEKIINNKPTPYLIENVVVKGDFKYLLIDDESEKGWGTVLERMMPEAHQTIWNTPVSSYSEISKDIRKQIENGDFDLVFLDLRMAGVAEEDIVKPEGFSGMRILQSIKRINPGIQVIMLTATNKGWNVKAMLDAGADGYYMKESPEYHFSLEYSEQNAQALKRTIQTCVANAYLQDICAEMKTIKLPTDSGLSPIIYNQLQIAQSLILKAKSNSEYAFAYIALEQVFEIATSFLIRREYSHNQCYYFFTEGTKEPCKLYNCCKPSGLLQTNQSEKSVALWTRVSAIYYQLYDGNDNNFAADAKKCIDIRNNYIHPQNGHRPEITSQEFLDLFYTVVEFLSVFK